MKITHLTSVHSRYDTRIFLKQCRTLAAQGHVVALVVADGKGPERIDGVEIIDVGTPTGRLNRLLVGARKVVSRGATTGADVFHLHDPELLLSALMLKKLGKKVIYDSHEDLPEDILAKNYIPTFLRRPLSALAAHFQYFICRRIDRVVAATPTIEAKFQSRGIRATAVRNYPIISEFCPEDSLDPGQNRVCYVGGISSNRGIREILSALMLCQTEVRLALAGTISEKGLRDELEAMPGWSRVDDLGFVDRGGVRQVFATSIAGLVTLHPTKAFLDSLPIKMFEYMSASLPVIASNFPQWQEIVEGNDCGICVDPKDPQAIATAIDRLMSDKKEARRMGEKARMTAIERYSWDAESTTLTKLYENMAPQTSQPPGKHAR